MALLTSLPILAVFATLRETLPSLFVAARRKRRPYTHDSVVSAGLALAPRLDSGPVIIGIRRRVTSGVTKGEEHVPLDCGAQRRFGLFKRFLAARRDASPHRSRHAEVSRILRSRDDPDKFGIKGRKKECQFAITISWPQSTAPSMRGYSLITHQAISDHTELQSSTAAQPLS